MTTPFPEGADPGPLGYPGGTEPGPSPSLPPPGWYPDPWARGSHRYWDGQRWTTQTMSGPRR